jgi:hypothetical protein
MHCCVTPTCTVLNQDQESRRSGEPGWVLTQLGQLTHPHPSLRADPPSEQQVHSKVSLRRAVDAV